MGAFWSQPATEASDTKAALDAMDAAGLLSLMREMHPSFDEALRARFTNTLIDRAAHNASGRWVPDGPPWAGRP